MLSPPLRDPAELTAALGRANIDLTQLVVDEKGTLCSAGGSATVEGKRVLPVLTGEGEAEIQLKGALSQGGMGQILVAEQLSLGREVAVKIVGKGKGGTVAEAELVVEGRIAGQLEHPNIVPIHILGASTDGKPLIVMKRIDGESWKDQLKGRASLARDLDILTQVCRALEFAHARGVVHRDVKPANVMVGRYGEVYLLDWGLALAVDEAAPAELPRARDVKTLAGTPQYMAPEMVLPTGAISVRTDVYLLGAVLYELIAGKPPHAGTSVSMALFRAHAAVDPVIPADAPEELAEICTKALKRDPAERYGSVAELRGALEEFKSHAAARALCAVAEERLGWLATTPIDEGDAREAQQAFTEARFGFSQALEAWPDSTRAREGLERSFVLMARREVAAGHDDAAAILISELDSPPPELVSALEALRGRRRAEAANVEELQRFARDKDTRFASRERAYVLMGAAAGWLATMFVLGVMEARGLFSAGPGTFAVFMVFLSSAMVASAWVFPRLRATSASRSMLIMMTSCVVALAMLHGAGWWFGIAPAPMLAFGHACLAVTTASLATQDSRIWSGAALSAAIVPAIVAVPEHVFLVSGVGAFLALAAIASRWVATAREGGVA